MEGLEECPMVLYEIDDIFLSYGDTIYPDALTEIDEVRRGVEPYLIACRLENSCNGVRTRTLAIGACHVDGLELAVRVSEVCVQLVSVVESFLVSVLAHVLEEGSAVEQVCDSFLVGHSGYGMVLKCHSER
jgi:hypothetical protein